SGFIWSHQTGPDASRPRDGPGDTGAECRMAVLASLARARHGAQAWAGPTPANIEARAFARRRRPNWEARPLGLRWCRGCHRPRSRVFARPRPRDDRRATER